MKMMMKKKMVVVMIMMMMMKTTTKEINEKWRAILPLPIIRSVTTAGQLTIISLVTTAGH